ncbi:hypothetical protein H6G97_29410 [Nostoc flagelliforme FACHB-838]|uniref:Uncharacterized protein n=1 Tax=Nostoc flagelliforme FACHB-838 TaxID=2692904 RepID=A0ABR8DYK8_9NOSO|nr:hypothetical protein [Nostoc flagelliforme]MBD2533458.1 hypothetical protein [Nostoc flagelliforme FACHB-838]
MAELIIVMQPTLKHYADYWLMGQASKLCSHAEIIAWADQLLEESDHPADWMIELSTSQDKHLLDVIHLLDCIPGERDFEVSFRLLIAKLGVVYPIVLPENGRFAQPEHSQLFSKLYFLINKHNELSDDLQKCIYQIYSDLDDIEQGYCDWSVIQQDYEELLCAGRDYKQWIDFKAA